MLNQSLIRNWMSSPVITVAPEMSLSDVHKIMSAESIRNLPVVKNGKLMGIITRRGLLRADRSSLHYDARQQANHRGVTVERVMTRGVITTSTHTVIPIAARVMSENKISALPVMDDANNLTGIITSSDLLRVIIQELPRQKRTIQVREYMTPGVVTIQPNTSLLEAHRLMAVERIRALPVLDEDKLVGVVTRTDLMSADHPAWMDDARDSELAMRIELEDVSRIMSRNVITIRPEADIVEAARQMCEGKFHCLPVVDESNQLVGILTETDLFRLITRVFY